MKLSLFNTLTRKIETFIPIDKSSVKMYVCGPTVYDRPHIGNARSVVIYDLLYRILSVIYGQDQVKYVRNITDIDDKIIDRAKERKISIEKLTKETIYYFHHDMNYLGCLSPTIEPKATGHIDQMLYIIDKQIKAGCAYEAEGDVYFDISKSKDYTLLSGRPIDEMLEGVRIENNKNKRHPADFVLWKLAKDDDDPSAKFASPFGIGRPGWHIECSAMSNEYLGETFDIHGGGADLIFPHHTNEIAQSTAAFPGSRFANYWVHNGFLTVNHDKMSKSLGNFITVKDLIDQGLKGDIVRLFLLGTHYRKPLDYNNKALQDAEKTISYWYTTMQQVPDHISPNHLTLPDEFLSSLLDDMNTSLAISIINEYAKAANQSKSIEEKISKINLMYCCASFLGLVTLSIDQWFGRTQVDQNIQNLIKQREKAKKEKNWPLADQIRSDLNSKGIVLEDKSDGTTIWRKK